jgi:biotin synthase
MSPFLADGEESGGACPADWHGLADRVLDGHRLSFEEAMTVLRCPDDQLWDLLSAAFRVRRRFFGRSVQLYFLVNAKSGLCPEDCAYCSQSKVATSKIPKYNLLSRDALLAGAEAAQQRRAKTYCIVISARGPSERELAELASIVPEIKARYDLKICVSLGLLTAPQAQRLKACGVDRVNHNVNTSPEYYAEICATHTYQDRIATLHAVRDAGLELCSGGIVGMGEKDSDVVQMALALRDLGADSIPINFLLPVDGTPLAKRDELNPRYCLKVLALFRLVNPDTELRIAGGRERHLGSMQCLGLLPANSIFVGDYLTTPGQLPEADYRMIEEMGLEVTPSRPSEKHRPRRPAEEAC